MSPPRVLSLIGAGIFFASSISQQWSMSIVNLCGQMKMRKFFILTITIIFLASCAPSKEKHIVIKENRYYQCEPTSTIHKKMVKLINDVRNSRRRCGKKTFSPTGAVKWNNKLAIAALNQAKDMAMSDMFGHTGSDGSSVRDRVEKAGYYWQIVAENIGAGRQTSEAVVSLWLDSPGHCANLMRPGITEIGAACFRNPESKYGTYWALVMAVPGD